jgi:hypothetical protein
VKTVTKITFSSWLRQSLLFIGYKPVVWVGYMLMVGLLLMIGPMSLATGIFFSVTCLFVGVGVAKYIDLKHYPGHQVGFYWAVTHSLPLAILAAVTIVTCWFVFMAIANILSGELYKITRFFFYWQFTQETLNHKSIHQIAGWIYSYANITLIFVLLMLTTFASWFSFPLMLFKDYSWSQAKTQSDKAVSKNQGAIYKMLGFIFAEAILCSTLTPLLTPALYMLVSTMMYVSYKSIFLKPPDDHQ